jgi:allantoin racemase
MKISCHLPISMPREGYGTYLDLLKESYEIFKDKETEVTIKDVPNGIKQFELVWYSGFRSANEREILKTMVAAEAEGFDAIASACYFDSAVKAASNLLTIPVVGPAEATMNLATMMGNRFAVITSDEVFVEEKTHHLMQLGFGPKAILNKPVRTMTLPFDELIHHIMTRNFDPLVENFTKIAQGCLEDGADVIIAGCGIISPIMSLAKLTEIDGAPVIDPMIISLKMAELLAKFQKLGLHIKSTRGLFDHPPEDLKKQGLKELGLI